MALDSLSVVMQLFITQSDSTRYEERNWASLLVPELNGDNLLASTVDYLVLLVDILKKANLLKSRDAKVRVLI